MDTITLSDVVLWTHIGVPDEEQKKEQPITLTVTCAVDCSQVANTDDMSDGVDYEQLMQKIRVHGKDDHKTLERLCTTIADDLLQDTRITDVSITAAKRIFPDCDSVSVTIERP